MKALLRSLALAGALAVLGASSVIAAPRIGGCPPGPGETGTADIHGWELWTEAQFIAEALLLPNGDPEAVSAEFAKYNRNGDAVVCVMKQVLPNDASGSTTWFVAHDNTHP